MVSDRTDFIRIWGSVELDPKHWLFFGRKKKTHLQKPEGKEWKHLKVLPIMAPWKSAPKKLVQSTLNLAFVTHDQLTGKFNDEKLATLDSKLATLYYV